ncbi:2-polyprenyl-3-methyl-6-methoxy-1,4-benzoquinone monooxygenase [Legionella spiritensis]|uniref:3-demethoxyubiquinol 3-hydroxylase n=1 Tax=Legionella spiritensis TaxID=452 RepID=A0A0W0YX51_LEGSP|nr:2-polyprenyl-3-methyl-6-methoxy-1,4-benzoquinone monooxygenase [Legionella spiritensis]KTD61247.1 ubiquinone biosynthesis protein [Legionella spiritensis]SNV23622.1 ubiquinone biosynthesis protein [Legionella spiritensis]
MPIYNLVDRVLGEFDTALRTMLPPPHRESTRPVPGETVDEKYTLTEREKKEVAGLMRVNHAGEVCAQALYQGQALTAKLTCVKEQMTQAAEEEIEHLAWCEQRLRELDSRPSVLNPFWYIGSLLIGAAAGIAGDRWSLGFVAETERQVSTHLRRHMEKIPEQDERTRHILEQMHEDETHHAEAAKNAGAAELPKALKNLMGMVSKLMTKTSYYL